MQLVIVILHAKYELSILYSCEDIFDKSVEKKKEEHIQGRINRRMPVLNPTMQQVIVNLHNINLLSGTVAEKSITKKCSIDCMERKRR